MSEIALSRTIVRDLPMPMNTLSTVHDEHTRSLHHMLIDHLFPDLGHLVHINHPDFDHVRVLDGFFDKNCMNTSDSTAIINANF